MIESPSQAAWPEFRSLRSDGGERVLEALLSGLQLQVEIVSDVRYCGSWYEVEKQTQRGQFHLIGDGHCQIEGPMLQQPIHLQGGDLAIFPHGTPHILSAVDTTSTEARQSGYTSMLCGEIEFAMGYQSPMLRALPQCMVVHSVDGGDAFRHVASLLLGSAHNIQMGQRIIMNKLAESLFTLAVCSYAYSASNPQGVIAALSDPRMCRALGAIHERPSDSWTIEKLAQAASMSRSAIAKHFAEVIGMPPMQSLRHWRISQAKTLLRNPKLSVAAVAERLGYASETAFRKLFKRMVGIGPGGIRNQNNNQTDTHPSE